MPQYVRVPKGKKASVAVGLQNHEKSYRTCSCQYYNISLAVHTRHHKITETNGMIILATEATKHGISSERSDGRVHLRLL